MTKAMKVTFIVLMMMMITEMMMTTIITMITVFMTIAMMITVMTIMITMTTYISWVLRSADLPTSSSVLRARRSTARPPSRHAM
jgi:hypothetical protein